MGHQETMTTQFHGNLVRLAEEYNATSPLDPILEPENLTTDQLIFNLWGREIDVKDSGYGSP